jgi:hypothetical protein
MKVCFVSMLLNLQTRSFELLFNCCYLLAIERCFQQWRPTNVYHSSMVMDGYHLFTYSIGLPITYFFVYSRMIFDSLTAMKCIYGA